MGDLGLNFASATPLPSFTAHPLFIGGTNITKMPRSLQSKTLICYSNIPGLQHFKMETGKYRPGSATKKKKKPSGHVIHSCIPSTGKANTGSARVQGQPPTLQI